MVKKKIKGKERKIVRRTCTGCGQVKDKNEMLRIVKTPDGKIKYNLNGKIPGRGAYICYDISCVEMAFKKRSLTKTLKKDVPINLKDDIISIISNLHEKIYK